MTGLTEIQPVHDNLLVDATEVKPLPHASGRIRSQDLLQQRREIEIDHDGRIYRLRLTQHNKLILTA